MGKTALNTIAIVRSYYHAFLFGKIKYENSILGALL